MLICTFIIGAAWANLSVNPQTLQYTLKEETGIWKGRAAHYSHDLGDQYTVCYKEDACVDMFRFETQRLGITLEKEYQQCK